jgi:glycosyltransferase involved in cell wall biosynthesis
VISVVIPTLDEGASLPGSLAALVPAAAEGLVREVIVADGGSADDTLAVADAMGCRIVPAERPRAARLVAGAAAARGPWLLFLHPGTVLGEGWTREAHSFIEIVERDGAGEGRAAAFRFALDGFSARARVAERVVALRCTLLGLPYGEQGLLIPARLYRGLGGHRPLAALEDADLARRIGRRRLVLLRSAAVVSPGRDEQAGFGRRALRDLSALALLLAGVDPARLAARTER